MTLSAVLTVPEMFAGFKFVISEPSPDIVPDTVKLTRVPRLVIFDCVFPETTRATFALATFPVRFDALMFEIPNPFEAVKSPFTVRPVRVPTLVIFV